MIDAAPPEISAQLSKTVDLLEQHLAPTLTAVHLYGSALVGGLKRYSDVDLLVTVTRQPDPSCRRALLADLLHLSAWPGESSILRALEVTGVVRDDVVPWRYPPMRAFQFGEWQREEILAGRSEPAVVDPDLAILLTKVRQRSVALVGPAADRLFDPVPEDDLYRALAAALTLWSSPRDWAGDERNVTLTLARIWYTVATGKIAPKDSAASWAIERVPEVHRSILLEAREAYLGHGEDRLASRADQVTAFVSFSKGEIAKALGSKHGFG